MSQIDDEPKWQDGPNDAVKTVRADLRIVVKVRCQVADCVAPPSPPVQLDPKMPLEP